MMEALLVADDFDRNILIGFVVECANHLAKASLSNHLENLVTVTNVIVDNLQERRDGNLIKF